MRYFFREQCVNMLRNPLKLKDGKFHDMRDPRVTIIVLDKNVGRFLLQVNKMCIPQKVVKILSLKRERDRIRTLGYPVEEAAYACSGKRCSPAFAEPDRLTAGIRRFMENLNRKDKMD